MHYVLDENGTPVAEPDLLKWAKWFENGKLQVARETIGDALIETVFLGLDHSCGGSTPVLWETAVSGGKHDQEHDRCSGSREQAEAMHAKMVERVKRL